MKIMICGSMSFAKEMLETQRQLQELGHQVDVPCDTEEFISGRQHADNLEADRQHCVENDIMRKCFDLVAAADAVLVVNYPRHGVDGNIGTSALMELGLAYHLKKKLFLLYPIPSSETVRWAHEVSIFQPTIIHADLTKVC